MVLNENWVGGDENYKKWGTVRHTDLGSTPEEVAQYIVDNPDDFREKAVEKAQAILDL
jgi:hypothetical protein